MINLIGSYAVKMVVNKSAYDLLNADNNTVKIVKVSDDQWTLDFTTLQ